MRIDSSQGNPERIRLMKAFNEKNSGLQVLCLSYLTSNEGLNLHEDCSKSYMVEQGRTYAMEVQAWSRVRRIGQKKCQEAIRLINPRTSDALQEAAIRDRQDADNIALGIIAKAQENQTSPITAAQMHELLTNSRK